MWSQLKWDCFNKWTMLSMVYDLLNFKHAFLSLKGMVLIDSLSKTVTTMYKSTRLLLILSNCSVMVSRNYPKIFNCHWIWLFFPSCLLIFNLYFEAFILNGSHFRIYLTFFFHYEASFCSVSILKTILSDLNVLTVNIHGNILL